MSSDLIRDSLEYLDRNIEKNNDFLKKIKYISFKWGINSPIIFFYDSNKNIIHTSNYEIIGTYIHDYKSWTWAWSVPTYAKKFTYIITDILKYGINLDTDNDNLFLRSELINSRFKISNKIQLEIHTSIAAYLSKKPLVFNYVVDLDLINRLDKKKDNTDNLTPVRYLSDYDFDNLPENSVVQYLFIFDVPK